MGEENKIDPAEKVESSSRTHVGGLINHWGQYICSSNSSYVGPDWAAMANTPLDGPLTPPLQPAHPSSRLSGPENSVNWRAALFPCCLPFSPFLQSQVSLLLYLVPSALYSFPS